jgi:hypothetical protein
MGEREETGVIQAPEVASATEPTVEAETPAEEVAEEVAEAATEEVV